MLKIKYITLSLLCVILLVFPRTGKAVLGVGDIVFDPTNYIENLMQAYNTAEQIAQEAQQIAHQVTQITNQVRQIENQVHDLAHLDYSSLDDNKRCIKQIGFCD